ncbi:hypothetical protein [Prescottella agglutinans]|uniref:Tail terminator n=1 Tax=Prescottella agglutinans TaxID=1644129 RepID=A0ABT6MFY0_9NOCA|nr:hypothetical protein [Prescottella agglutinans]MDH6283227.1 hypothetical protein [Prescottella agglutinans]
MSELVIFPDLEPTLVQYVQAELDARSMTVTVASKVPGDRPENMVRISGVGGTRRNVLHEDAGVLIECWCPQDDPASDLARLVRALLDDVDIEVQDGWITSSSSSTPVCFPDPLTQGASRFQFTAEFLTQGRVFE